MTDVHRVPSRASTRARTSATAASLTLRPVTELIRIEHAWGVWLSRQIVARSMATFGPPPRSVRVEPVDERLPDGRRVVGEWVRARGVTRTDAALYYVHGSGYVLCSTRTHRGLTARLSALTGLPVFSVDYRLAPRHRFPAAADDVRAGWDWLLAQGHPADRLVVAGDSAGGHLAVDLALQLRRDGAPAAAAQALFSPLYDLTLGLARRRERLRRDPLISAARAERMVRLYVGQEDPAHPRLALTVAGGPALPPTLVQAGGAEMLLADAHRLARDLRSAGGPCELDVWPDQVHVFQALPRLAPEASMALRRAAAFLTEELARAGSSDVPELDRLEATA